MTRKSGTFRLVLIRLIISPHEPFMRGKPKVPTSNPPPDIHEYGLTVVMFSPRDLGYRRVTPVRVIGPQRIGAAVMRLLKCTACALEEEAIYKSRKPSPVIRTIQEYPGDLSPEEGHRVTTCGRVYSPRLFSHIFQLYQLCCK